MKSMFPDLSTHTVPHGFRLNLMVLLSSADFSLSVFQLSKNSTKKIIIIGATVNILIMWQ